MLDHLCFRLPQNFTQVPYMHLEVANLLPVMESIWKYRRKEDKKMFVSSGATIGSCMSTLRLLGVEKVSLLRGHPRKSHSRSLPGYLQNCTMHLVYNPICLVWRYEYLCWIFNDKISHHFTNKWFWNKSRVFHIAMSSYLITFRCTDATKWMSEFLYT